MSNQFAGCLRGLAMRQGSGFAVWFSLCTSRSRTSRFSYRNQTVGIVAQANLLSFILLLVVFSIGCDYFPKSKLETPSATGNSDPDSPAAAVHDLLPATIISATDFIQTDINSQNPNTTSAFEPIQEPPALNQNSLPRKVSTASTAALADGLVYLWKAGVETSYEFTIEHESGDSTRTTKGVCSYTVDGDAPTEFETRDGSGTGFIVDSNGILATCAHVVEGAKHIEVVLGGRAYSATVIGVDQLSDVALIQIAKSGLQPLSLVDSDTVQLAESVRAIGYPLSELLGTDMKVTTGTVAGFVPQPGNASKQIQVDAAINPGNSGGPVVNGAGQVIGVASAKLSGAAITAIGFVVPVNALRQLAASHGLQLSSDRRGAELSGPDVARLVTPSVALIKVSGVASGRIVKVGFNASFTERETRRNRGGFAYPSPPSLPKNSYDRGSLTVSSKGKIVDFEGREQLPAILGPVGMFFIEPLDSGSQATWSLENETTLQRIQERQSPFGLGFGPQFFGPRIRGFGIPGMLGDTHERVVEEIPAVERSSYQILESSDGTVLIDKKYSYIATRRDDQPYVKIEGNGKLVFDVQLGMPASLDYNANIEHSEGGSTVHMPVRVTYVLRDPEEVWRQRETDMQQAEEIKQKQELDRTQPNPDRVDQLIGDIRQAEGGVRAILPLEQLSNVAVVEAKRVEVLNTASIHMQNDNAAIKKAATQVFCQWATESEKEKLLIILQSDDSLLYEAKKKALASLKSFIAPEDLPVLIDAMSDLSVRIEVKNKLIAMGSQVEAPIMEGFPKINDSLLKITYLEILRKVGTRDSIDFLEGLTRSNDLAIKLNAQQALDAIRSRL